MKLYEINKEYKLQISYFTEKQNTTLKILLKSFDWLTGMMNIGYKFCDQIINEVFCYYYLLYYIIYLFIIVDESGFSS